MSLKFLKKPTNYFSLDASSSFNFSISSGFCHPNNICTCRIKNVSFSIRYLIYLFFQPARNEENQNCEIWKMTSCQTKQNHIKHKWMKTSMKGWCFWWISLFKWLLVREWKIVGQKLFMEFDFSANGRWGLSGSLNCGSSCFGFCDLEWKTVDCLIGFLGLIGHKLRRTVSEFIEPIIRLLCGTFENLRSINPLAISFLDLQEISLVLPI